MIALIIIVLYLLIGVVVGVFTMREDTEDSPKGFNIDVLVPCMFIWPIIVVCSCFTQFAKWLYKVLEDYVDEE